MDMYKDALLVALCLATLGTLWKHGRWHGSMSPRPNDSRKDSCPGSARQGPSGLSAPDTYRKESMVDMADCPLKPLSTSEAAAKHPGKDVPDSRRFTCLGNSIPPGPQRHAPSGPMQHQPCEAQIPASLAGTQSASPHDSGVLSVHAAIFMPACSNPTMMDK
ncbi:hypothetical protein BDK51DRAFT_39148 [Blyttiomyces helicus]|uniref:Uncharacterized protein n=1 Tax=Blyttiomyces helicus TaxID=388810 RepID=A0A4V1IQK0_9FUNG|nr:hypothetical protein BDK51DRAFT_39148 [Blyttiomyces helicus]|eukprot:RKO86827.1 hypothetical protein BDK51DRAFT_39148 [Blyttiomyces helicus]